MLKQYKTRLNKILAFCIVAGDDQLEDLRENVEAPLEQLNKEGQFIVKIIHSYDITTQDKLDKYYKENMKDIEKIMNGFFIKIVTKIDDGEL